MDDQGKIKDAFEQVSRRILSDARNELYLGMRYLDLPLRALKVVISTDIRVIGTDGNLTGFDAGVERKLWLLRHEASHL